MIFGLALGIACTQAYERGYLDGDVFGSAQANAPAITLDKLTKLSAKYNARLPMMMDKETRWDRSKAGPGLELKYYYTVVNYRADQINSRQIKQHQWKRHQGKGVFRPRAQDVLEKRRHAQIQLQGQGRPLRHGLRGHAPAVRLLETTPTRP